MVFVKNNKKKIIKKNIMNYFKKKLILNIEKSNIHYKNIEFLKKFINEEKKILKRSLIKIKLKYYRKIVNAIKLARYLALLPYINN